MHRARMVRPRVGLSWVAVLSVVAVAGGVARAQETGTVSAVPGATPAAAAYATAAPGAPAPAAAATAATGVGSAPDGFAPAAGPPTERIPGGPLVIAAYAAIWTLLLIFLASMWIRQESLRKELERLRERIAGDPARAATPEKPGAKG